MSDFRVIVTGGRHFEDYDYVRGALTFWVNARAPEGAKIVIVHGDCPTGADRLADRVAWEQGWGREPHPAAWGPYGNDAGPRRNREMVEAGAGFLIAFPGGRGTAGCTRLAREAGIQVVKTDGKTIAWLS